jgi:hypothetical protein
MRNFTGGGLHFIRGRAIFRKRLFTTKHTKFTKFTSFTLLLHYYALEPILNKQTKYKPRQIL